MPEFPRTALPPAGEGMPGALSFKPPPQAGEGRVGVLAHRQKSLQETILLLPKIVVTALLVLAIADMLAGVFLRYVMVEITDFFDLDPVNFFWVEEVGELSLTWMTMIGAAIGIADRIHFTLHVLTHHLPLQVQRTIYVINHLLIAGFGLLAGWYGTKLAITNS